MKSKHKLGTGKHTINLDFASDKQERRSGGMFTLTVDGKRQDHKRTDKSFWLLVDITEGFDVGMDSVSPVDDLYTRESGKFNGVIDKITFKLK